MKSARFADYNESRLLFNAGRTWISWTSLNQRFCYNIMNSSLFNLEKPLLGKVFDGKVRLKMLGRLISLLVAKLTSIKGSRGTDSLCSYFTTNQLSPLCGPTLLFSCWPFKPIELTDCLSIHPSIYPSVSHYKSHCTGQSNTIDMINEWQRRDTECYVDNF